MQLYFEEGGNIGDHAVLVEAARASGMDASVVEALLATDKDRDTVLAEIETAQRMGVTGVPCFLLEGRYAVMGAQDTTSLPTPSARSPARRHAGSWTPRARACVLRGSLRSHLRMREVGAGRAYARSVCAKSSPLNNSPPPSRLAQAYERQSARLRRAGCPLPLP